MTEIIFGVHPVVEALRCRGEAVAEVIIAKGVRGPWLTEVRALARQYNLKLRIQERAALDRLCHTRQHQGILARVGKYRYISEDKLLARVHAGPEPPLVVAADCLQDPMNLGNLIRSAYAAGAQAVVIPKDRAVGVTPTVIKAAAGALEHLPVARVTNLAVFLRRLKESGLWVVGAEAQALQSLYDANLTGPLALVIGSEDQGLRSRVRQECDLLLAIPMAVAQLGSLNAATAGAIFLFEIYRQRLQASGLHSACSTPPTD